MNCNPQAAGAGAVASDSPAGPLGMSAAEAVNEYLAPIRARRTEYAQDRTHLRQTLRDGNERARAVADTTLAEVRAAMNSHC